jgi:6-pyruvoyltetrahydropterin/6-carboxytetrahydropterin synthase
MEIFRVFRIEAAHSLSHLPSGHPCRKTHGHSWRVEIYAAGPVAAGAGWVMDFADLERAFQPLLQELDHAHLNEITGLEIPTSENLARWIWRRLQPALPLLSRVVIWETETAGCSYRGEHETGC